MRLRFVTASTALAVACAIANDARADDEPDATTIAPAARKDASEYRGRTNPTTAGEAIAWVPRVVCFPLYLTTDLILRRPIYGLAEWLDESNALRFLRYRIFEPTPTFSWYPTFWVDLGTPLSVGLQFSIKNLFTRNDELQLIASTGGLYFWHFRAEERVNVGPVFFGARGDYLSRPDRGFFGMGPYSGDVETHFRQTRYEAGAFVGVGRTQHFTAELYGAARGERSAPGDDPSIETRFDTSTIPGYGERIDLALASASFALDTRKSVDDPGGARLTSSFTYAQDFSKGSRSFIETKSDARVAFEVSKPDRVLGLRLYFVDTVPLGSDPVPFTDQAMLGYDNHLGFEWGRFRGESAVLAELEYRYPIAYYFDALWRASAGNVFKRDLSDFDAKALTMSFGLALRTRRWGHSPFEVGLAFGTTRFDEAFGVQNIRAYAGVWEGP